MNKKNSVFFFFFCKFTGCKLVTSLYCKEREREREREGERERGGKHRDKTISQPVTEPVI